ncbi:MAG: gliding motility lipoprotein GldD [Bacteroidales bacterium]|jgi:gliding motility-associated lipoprotein GldD|nr:gliding motility lipoprotein GldD [Bacteroidales bacterium]
MKFFYFGLIVIAFLVSSCGADYTPKPRGYFRIDLPQREYRVFDTTAPYTFEYPKYASIVYDSSKMAEPYWINIYYSRFHATLHVSYKVIHNNLANYLEDARTLVNKHIPKANSITQKEYDDPGRRVYGLVYEIKGSDAASSYQFYLTDSISEFVRGALYFNLVPNNDSLAPVIDFLKGDIDHMINTFRWKKAKYD